MEEFGGGCFLFIGFLRYLSSRAGGLCDGYVMTDMRFISAFNFYSVNRLYVNLSKCWENF